MNRKQLTSILVAVVVLGGLGLWLRYRSTSAYRPSAGRMGEKVLGEFDVNAVAHVTIQHGSNQVDLVKTDGKWTVQQRGGYPADFGDISEVLRSLWELKVTQPVEVGESRLGRLELLPAEAEDREQAGTLVDLKDQDGKAIRKILLGKQHRRKPTTPSPYGGDEGWPDGRYVMTGDGSELEPVSLVTESFSNVRTEADQWLNKDFFKVEKIKTITVTYPGAEATNSFAVTRESETADLRLVAPRPDESLDSSKVSGLKSVLGYPGFNDVVLDPKPEETGLDDPKVGVIETFENFTYTLEIGNTDADDSDYYVRVDVDAVIPEQREPGEDESDEDKEKLDPEFQEKVDTLKEKLEKEQALGKWTFLASKWSFDSLLKKRGELMTEPKDEEADAGEAAEVGSFPVLPPGLPVDALEVIPSGPVPPPSEPKTSEEATPLPPASQDESGPESPTADEPTAETPGEEPTLESAAPETAEDTEAPAPPELPDPAESEPEAPSTTEEGSAPETPESSADETSQP